MKKGSPRVTRKQARSWLAPMRACFQEMQSGAATADAETGFLVTRTHERDEWVRTDWCISGFRGLIVRLFPDIQAPAMLRIRDQIAAQRLISRDDLVEVMREIRLVEDRLIRITHRELRAARVTEEISIEMEAHENEEDAE